MVVDHQSDLRKRREFPSQCMLYCIYFYLAFRKVYWHNILSTYDKDRNLYLCLVQCNLSGMYYLYYSKPFFFLFVTDSKSNQDEIKFENEHLSIQDNLSTWFQNYFVLAGMTVFLLVKNDQEGIKTNLGKIIRLRLEGQMLDHLLCLYSYSRM